MSSPELDDPANDWDPPSRVQTIAAPRGGEPEECAPQVELRLLVELRGPDGWVTVMTPEGAVLFEGPTNACGRLVVRVPVDRDTAQVRMRTETCGRYRETIVPVEPGRTTRCRG